MSAGSGSVSTSIAKAEFKRLILIGIQIRNIFEELTDESDEEMKKWQQAVEEKYVKSFTFYAMKSGKVYAELEVSIDWKEHEKQINRGNLIIKTKTPNGILAPTKNIVKRFHEYTEKNGFEIEWQLRYADHVDRKEAQRKFGTSVAEEVIYADEESFISRDYMVGDLTELTYTMKI